MKIRGPIKDLKKPASPKKWFLDYRAPVLRADGSMALDERGRPRVVRHRPYYESKDAAQADKERILTQYSATGSGEFLFNRDAATDYEEARNIVGDGVSMVAIAEFWRMHHPSEKKKKLHELLPAFLQAVEMRRGDGRHLNDLKSRLKKFMTSFGDRYPDAITRLEILGYVLDLKNEDGSKPEPRTIRNHKTALSNFFSWLVEQGHLKSSPASGIKKRMLPKEVPKEIEFLSLEFVERYLRCAERYDPRLVAHEIIQLISGVRSDDEMENFRAEFVLPQTKEIKIPASIAKTGKREIIDNIEPNFWAWWAHYGPKEGLLRPGNYDPRWRRLRVLAATEDGTQADQLAKLPIKTLLALPSSPTKLERWPWNARRRSFCTYHIALHQSADKTALILRHRGAASTLHNSYRGLGVTQDQGRAYFAFLPQPVATPIRPQVHPKGIVKQQAERRAVAAR